MKFCIRLDKLFPKEILETQRRIPVLYEIADVPDPFPGWKSDKPWIRYFAVAIESLDTDKTAKDQLIAKYERHIQSIETLRRNPDLIPVKFRNIPYIYRKKIDRVTGTHLWYLTAKGKFSGELLF